MKDGKRDRVNIGIIGLGYMGRHHLLALRQLEQDGEPCKVRGVCDTDDERLALVTGKHPVEIVTTAPEEVIQDERIDAIFVATPWPTHKHLVELVISHGKDLYCEKPLGIDLAESRALAQLASQAGVVSQAGLCLRHQPALWKIKQIVDSGSYGRLLFVLLREDSKIPEVGDLYQSALAKRLAGRGILWEENIHDLDTLVFLAGMLKLEHCSMGFSPSLEAETSTRLCLRSEADVQVSFSSLWHTVEGRGSSRHLEVFLESAVLMCDYFTSGDVAVQVAGAQPYVLEEQALRAEFVQDMGFRPELANRRRYPWYATHSDLAFVNSAKNRIPASPDLDDAMVAHEIAEYAYCASLEGGN